MPKKPVNIAFGSMPGPSLSEELKQQILAISPRIRLWDISGLIDREKRGDFRTREQLNDILGNTEIYFGSPLPDNIISRAPDLKWIQSPLAGTDQYLLPEVIGSPVILTKAKIHGEQISETVFCMMLMLARKSLEHFRAQQQKKWVRVDPVVLHGKTLGILGLGNIGLAVARLAKAFNMKVLAMKAHPQGRYKDVDNIYSSAGLLEIMKQSDFVVIILPITEETKNLIGEKELRLMKTTSFLINVARGGIVDENALVHALQQKWIAGAAFDVFATDPQPLPPDSRLWDLPNLIITPHNAGHRPDYVELVTRQFCINLKRYINGRELTSIVDKEKGY